MASEIRVNRLSNRSGLSTITFANGGVQFSGITTFANGDFRVGTGATILNPSTNEMQFHTGGSNRLTINNAGLNLGIGSITVGDATFTGSVSIGKTLTYEDVKNVDSIGVVTARTGVKITGGDFTVGTAITASSVTGNVTQDVGITTFSGSAVWFKGATANKDMYWSHASGSTVYKDNAQILMGDSSDLQIYHSGSHSFVEDTGAGVLSLKSNGSGIMLEHAGTGYMMKAFTGGAVEIYNNNSKKLETTSSGVSITGIPVATQSTGNIGLELHATGSGRGSQTKYHNDHGEAYVGTAGDTTGNLLIHNTSNTHMLFATNNIERVRIASDGKILMGVAANNGPAAPLHIYGSSNTTPILAFTRSSTHDDWQGGGIGLVDEGGTYKGALTFYTHGSSGTKNDSVTERLRIDSSGYVLAGHTTRDANIAHGTAGRMQLWGTSWANAGIALINTQASTDPAFLSFAKSRKASATASAAAVQSGDRLGEIRFAGDDGTDMHSFGASIAAYAQGTIAGNRMPGKLVFATTNDAADAVSASTRMVLYPSGQIDLGTGVVNIASFCKTGNNHQIVGQAADDVAALDVYSQHGNDADRLSFAVSDNRTGSKSNAFVVRGNGYVGINQSSPSEDLEVKGDQTATIFINAGQHDASTAQEATLKLGFNQSHANDSIGYVKLIEGGGNAYDGDLTFGVPYNNSGTPATREALRIKWNGNIGVGVNNPAFKFEVNGGADGSACFSGRTDGGNGNNVRFNLLGFADGGGANYGGGLKIQTRDTVNIFHDRLTIKSNGRTGIGTDAPQDVLTLYDADNNVGVYFQSPNTGNSGGDGLRIGRNNTHAFIWNYEDQPIAFATGGTERVTISNNNDTATLQLQDNIIGGVRVSVADETMSGDIHMSRKGCILAITSFTSYDVYPQPVCTGFVYLDMGNSKLARVMYTQSGTGADATTNVGGDLRAYNGTLDTTVSNYADGCTTIATGSSDGTFRIVNRTGNAYVYTCTFL